MVYFYLINLHKNFSFLKQESLSLSQNVWNHSMCIMTFSFYQIEKFGRHNVQFLNSYENFSVFKNILTVLFRVNAIILFVSLQFLTIKLRNYRLQATLDTWRISSTIENLYKIHCSHAVAILNCSSQQTMSIFFF